MPEMAFEDGVNNLRAILAARYEYLFGNWKTVEGFGHNNYLYRDVDSSLKVVVRNDGTQPAIWGRSCRIAGCADFRETFRRDLYGNKVFRIGGGAYYPDDAMQHIDSIVSTITDSLRYLHAYS
jgi:hypothetical protein